MLSVSKQNCITHRIISELVIEKTNEKCWIYHTFLRVLHHSQNHLRLHRGFYLCLNKSNKIHPILYFQSHLQKRRCKWVIIPEASCSVLLSFDGFFLLICSVKYKIVCLSKFKMNRLGSIYYRLNISLKNLNIELILHTRMILTGRMHIVFYKTK